MNNFDPVKFEALIEAGKKEEAQVYVEGCLDVEISGKESGKVMLEYTIAYMKAINMVNEAYKAELENILETLKNLKQLEKDTEDRIGLMKVRQDLNS
jgi:inorganic pyrophosphatase